MGVNTDASINNVSLRRIKLLLILLFSFLALPNLATRTLWQDEAETALVAKVVTHRGLPFAYDEQGPISQDWSYQFSVSSLWRWHPWLQFYIAAASFKLLGSSTLTARLPFTLMGIGFYAYFLHFLTIHGPKERKFVLIAGLLGLVSTPVLLHIRQGRYYAPSLLFTLMTIDGYLRLVQKKSSLRYILGSILLFHSFLPGALTLQVALWLHMLLKMWPITWSALPKIAINRNFQRFVLAFTTTLVFTLPWTIWLKIGGQNINFNPALVKQHLLEHYVYIHKFILPLFLFIPFLSSKIRQRYLKDEKMVLFALIIGVNLILYTFNHPYFFRYLVPLIPLFIFSASWLLTQLKPSIAALLGLTLIFMTMKTLPGYLFEITHPYRGTNEKLVELVNSLDQSSFKTLATNYDDFTFRFHTPLKVYGPQHLVDYPPKRDELLKDCPDIIVIYPQWGNEQRLSEIVAICKMKQIDTRINFMKLADDPSPVTHQYKPPTTGQLELYFSQ